ncbi:PREDICTED: craniofacial development protein 2-like [Nicotiana attenuata]|uniref:Uncharacterized protein n=1 Tax=Nicotiana attenuata TaxID=49451 RepID=A0A314KVJ0_NICAT|nr:PREDICTED: craniofacial development protein 2-like [Nicotiana attenuata]OIT32997.1 hypothetical protein A4A49_22572 [Nicotiana attenuata]
MPKKSNSKKPKPVDASPVVEKSKPTPSKPTKSGNEIDEIFAGKKRKKPEQLENSKSSGDSITEPKKLKKTKDKSSSRVPNVLSEPPRRQRKKTADGLTIYTEEELGLGKSNGGGLGDLMKTVHRLRKVEVCWSLESPIWPTFPAPCYKR